MRTYEIIRSYGKEKPDNVENLFKEPYFGSYYSPACTIIVKDNKYNVEGPDKEAVEYVKNLLDKTDGYLFQHGAIWLENGDHADTSIPVSFKDEKKFKFALRDSLLPPFSSKSPNMNLEPVK